MKNTNMKIGIFPGSFDPFTNGHINILKQACRVLDFVIVVIMCQYKRNYLFSTDERAEMIKEVIKEIPNAKVEIFEGILPEYVTERKATAMIRGLRMVADFEQEIQETSFFQQICPDVETIFFVTPPEERFITSQGVRNIAMLGGDVSQYVPEYISLKLKEKYLWDQAGK